ncbi:MFS transporter [Stenotrophomonas maltophilia]|uniref:MFS transporter n=1 Tax=Stenotrophomonas maltophilia TaxID=40324 RepID=UPI0015DFFF0F|nr:MFS transporter [Stenotrophomonas maltophilia]MBA0386599.1 MFS transporter [Stenotrophomonas maltophilia]MBA0391987.1 MFS transporter [Stenotrophomonas maltophilia]MBA0464431.1 MFS transporter [Stenotrophomonas maltophilia]MBA0471809.1 MFS transporter [Stenotrophomonas maltophilia]
MTGETAAAIERCPPTVDPSAETRIQQGTPAFRRTALALFLAGFSTFGLLYTVQPLLPEFSRHFGVSAAGSAMSLSLTTGTLAVAMLLAGLLSDAVGRRPLMIVALLASAMLSLSSALVDDWTTLLVLRTLLGLALSGVPAVAMTYLVEEMDSRALGLAMGLYIGGNAIGGMSGRLLAGIIADHWGWRWGIGVVSIIAVVSTVLLWLQLPPSRHFHPRRDGLRRLPSRWRLLFADPGLPWLFATSFVLMGVFVTLYNYLGYHLLAPPYHLSQTVVGLIFSVYLVGTFSSAWMGQQATRYGRGRILSISFALIGAGIALLAMPWLSAMALGIALVTFGFFGGHSVASSWVGSRAGTMRAEASAMYLFAYYLGSSVLGGVGGLAYAAWDWRGVCVFAAVLTLIGGGIVWALQQRAPQPVTA